MTPLVEIMAKKKEAPAEDKPQPKRKGRPKRGGRLSGRYVIVHSPEHRLWMDEFLAFTNEPEVAEVFREGLKMYAEKKGFREPPRL